MYRFLIAMMLRAPNDGGEGGGGSGGGGGGADGGGAPTSSGGGAAPSSSGQPAARQAVPPANTSFGDDNPAASGAADDPADSPEQREAKAKARANAKKYKVKRGGKEAEYDVDEIVRMVSDDYEEELPGPGGKPTRLKRAELLERARQGEGFLAKMRQLAEQERQLLQEREHGQKDPWSYLESRLGVEDHRELVMKKARELYAEDAKIARMRDRYVEGRDGKLYQNPDYNPVEANRLMEQRAAQKLERKNALDRQRAESEGKTKQQQENTRRRNEAVGGALKDAKIPVSSITMQLANEVIGEYQQARVKLGPQELASATRAKLRELVHGYLGGMDDDSLLSDLGDDFRKKLREIEAAAARGKKREDKAANGGGGAPLVNGLPNKGKTLSEADFNKKYRS